MSPRKPRPWTQDEIHELMMMMINKRLVVATGIALAVALVVIGLILLFQH